MNEQLYGGLILFGGNISAPPGGNALLRPHIVRRRR